MRRAFTLIELLVVIAIIAILAAILFPVFAAAKVAAKKAVAISNQKQISYGVLLYSADHDDLYPRNDDCYPGSSLNPALNTNPFNPVGVGCTTGAFYYRVNHFSWQKWVLPYIKNVQIFDHPLREKDSFQWATNGQIVGSFALNTGFTGQLDTYNRAPTFPRQFRNSWLGGMQTAIPDPGEAAILLEIPGTTVAMVPPLGVDPPGPVPPAITVYNIAVREWWRYKLMVGTQADCLAQTRGTEPDPNKVAAGGIVVGRADGSARFMPAAQFLAKTPTKLEYLGVSGSGTSGYSFGNDCTNPAGNVGTLIQPNLSLNYPMWGLTRG